MEITMIYWMTMRNEKIGNSAGMVGNGKRRDGNEYAKKQRKKDTKTVGRAVLYLSDSERPDAVGDAGTGAGGSANHRECRAADKAQSVIKGVM